MQREQNHVANALAPGQEHHRTVDADAKAAGGGHAVFEGFDEILVHDRHGLVVLALERHKSPGFAAGPCLFKDTMQLASYFNHQFYLGHSAMLVNEGLSDVVVEKAKQQAGGRLWGKTAGVLGMAFKANNDDTRESLSFRVKRGLEFMGARVLCHDPHIKDSTDLAELLRESDVIVLATPHNEYKDLQFEQPIIDIWGFYGMPELEIFPGTNSA